MKVKDRIDKLIKDNFIIIHKLYPQGIKLLDSDWIRIYKSNYPGAIDEMIYSLDAVDIDKIPEDILNLEYDKEDSWMIGGDLSLDLVINN